MSSATQCLTVSVFVALCSVTLAQDENARQEDDKLTPITEERLAELKEFHLDFDVDPDGNKLRPATDVTSTYVDFGCRLASSVPDSYPCVQQYVLRMGSRQSCGNLSPPYTGTTTIRFCEPGNEGQPATIRRFGVALSYVVVGGTLVEAYDVEGQLIGSIPTKQVGLDYVGFESDTPIAYVKIVPVNDKDPDFAFDDVMFDRPDSMAR